MRVGTTQKLLWALPHAAGTPQKMVWAPTPCHPCPAAGTAIGNIGSACTDTDRTATAIGAMTGSTTGTAGVLQPQRPSTVRAGVLHPIAGWGRPAGGKSTGKAPLTAICCSRTGASCVTTAVTNDHCPWVTTASSHATAAAVAATVELLLFPQSVAACR